MKYLLTISALFFTLQTSAQSHLTARDHLKKHQESILQKQAQKASNQKTTGNYWRLIAHSTHRPDYVLDTSRYYYSQGRGSKNYAYFISPYMSDYFDINSEGQMISCDSSFYWHGEGSFYDSVRRDYTYNNNNALLTLKDNTSYSLYEILSELTYNPNGTLNKTASSQLNGNVKIPQRITYYLYDAEGKRIMDSSAFFIPNPEGKTDYVYDVSGNLTEIKTYSSSGGNWEPVYFYKYVYDANSRLIYDECRSFPASGTLSGPADSFYYTGSSIIPSSQLMFELNMANNSLTPQVQYTNHINAQNQIDTVRTYNWMNGQLDTVEFFSVQYNSNSLPEHFFMHKYAGNKNFETIPYQTFHRYYEAYFPTSVAQVAAKKNEVVVYPNPIRDQMNIKTNIASGTVTIHNMLGQTVFSKQFAILNSSTIDMAAYPVGQYILRISSNAGETLHTQQLTKR